MFENGWTGFNFFTINQIRAILLFLFGVLFADLEAIGFFNRIIYLRNNLIFSIKGILLVMFLLGGKRKNFRDERAHYI